MTNQITIRDLKKIGLKHTPELDFSDDGTNFKMFQYHGIPVSYAKAYDMYFIAIRFDYIDGMTYENYKTFGSYVNADEFNGVGSVDLVKLKENLIAAETDMIGEWK